MSDTKCQQFWLVLGLKFGKSRLVVGGCGWFWVVVGGFGWLWVVPPFSMYGLRIQCTRKMSTMPLI